MSKTEQIDQSRLPRHIAIIMDGNGRWAKEHGHERAWGHENGVTTVRRITEIASELGVGFLTLYTFSTENWNRPKAEVDALMNLIVVSIEQQTPDLIKNNVRLTAIGDMDRMPAFARERLQRCMADTGHCTGLVLCLALSYSSHWELTAACRTIAAMAARGEIAPEQVDEQLVESCLATSSMPAPDLLIRTGGDLRISNFLLWQLAYSELYFTDKYWPDFTKDDFCDAIIWFQSRERRFGKTSEQIKNDENQQH
ncbi:MAG: isoprenyl transferase [Muribaculaceae bacterium]|nr:isoprenyl transferase [Muribaculaceae bacterium]HAP49766.1 isoprenyl transferase [Porphyromonadaceae bacterium]